MNLSQQGPAEDKKRSIENDENKRLDWQTVSEVIYPARSEKDGNKKIIVNRRFDKTN